MIGEAGVGKTAIVELLARRIRSGNVPKSFLKKRIYSLDLNSLVAGTKYRGQVKDIVLSKCVKRGIDLAALN